MKKKSTRKISKLTPPQEQEQPAPARPSPTHAKPASPALLPHASFQQAAQRNLIFIHGKGGVGKSSISFALAQLLAKKAPTLWVTLEDPLAPSGPAREIQPQLWHLNANFQESFEEYASMKIKVSALTRIFLRNKVIRYLALAAPGIRDLVLLGKVWYERSHYQHVVVDLPSTGYSIALFQSTQNFSTLFNGGPLHRDAEAMLSTFRDPQATGHLILGLPEEMPLVESLELNGLIQALFPKNPCAFLLNRAFPQLSHPPLGLQTTPFALSAEDYAWRRSELEAENIKIWSQHGLQFPTLSYVPPGKFMTRSQLAFLLSQQLAPHLSATPLHSTAPSAGFFSKKVAPGL